MRQVKKLVRQYRFRRTVIQIVNPLPKATRFIFINIPPNPRKNGNKAVEFMEKWDKIIKYGMQMVFYGTAMYKYQSTSQDFQLFGESYIAQQQKLIDAISAISAIRSAGVKDGQDKGQDGQDRGQDGQDRGQDGQDKGQNSQDKGQDGQVGKPTEDNKRLAAEKEVAELRLSGQGATEIIKDTEGIKKLAAEKEVEVRKALNPLNSKLKVIGNVVHDSVSIHDDEANNAVVRSWGEKRMVPKLKNHVELVELLGIADLKIGADVAGGRGFYLKGAGVRVNQALINFGLDLLEKRGYTALQTPFFMKKDIMGKCAQLAQVDEELYKVTGEVDDKNLIATAERPLCADLVDDWIHPSQLPIRYAGYSSCLRKEAGSHGLDSLGIFRVHQFEKVEQFCMHKEMIKNSEEFYEKLNLPYHGVSIVSGALNDAAAKKYDLEGWFPASQTYRELVSCSNCTDYQSRKLEIQFGQKKSNEQTKQYVHLLNSTVAATERTICCILENYQKEDGVEVPEVLRNFMGGVAFLPF